MAEYYHKVLPSGRCVRIEPLKTRRKLEVERFVAKINGDETDSTVETMVQCVKGYTEPRPFLYVERSSAEQVQRTQLTEAMTKLGIDKASMARALDAIYGSAVDTEAMLQAIPENEWHKTGPVELKTEGTSVLDVFEHAPDYLALLKGINDASGFGVAADPLIKATPTPVSVTSRGP